MVSVAILAGGHSARMGRDKSLMKLGHQLMVEHVIGRVKSLTDDLFICTNSPQKYSQFKLRSVPDIYPGRAALGGIYSGLKAARHPWVLVVACDMPFLNTALLQYLIGLAPAADAIVPRIDSSHPEVLHAVYNKACVPTIETLLRNNNYRIISLFNNISVRYVGRDEITPFDPEFLSFFNVNTPDDWEKACAIINARDDGV